MKYTLTLEGPDGAEFVREVTDEQLMSVLTAMVFGTLSLEVVGDEAIDAMEAGISVFQDMGEWTSRYFPDDES